MPEYRRIPIDDAALSELALQCAVLHDDMTRLVLDSLPSDYGITVTKNPAWNGLDPWQRLIAVRVWKTMLPRLVQVLQEQSAAEPEQEDTDWRPWHGGANPVPHRTVDIRFRSDVTRQLESSDLLRWSHADATDDIVEYRLRRRIDQDKAGGAA